MKATYCLPVLTGKPIEIPKPLGTKHFDGFDVRWEVGDDGALLRVCFTILGVELCLKNDVVQSSHPQLEKKAYEIATYLASCVLIQTARDALDPEQVLRATPSIQAETPEEEAVLRTHRRTVSKGTTLPYSTLGQLDPDTFMAGPDDTAALAIYADALRAQSPIIRYAALYRVVEQYFPGEEWPQLPEAVTRHVLMRDNRFGIDETECLQNLRSRCVHGASRRVRPVDPSNIEGIREVKDWLPLLTDLVRLLIQNPP